VATLVKLVRSHIDRWQSASVEDGVFGTTEPEAVTRYLEIFCEQSLGATAESALFYGSSAGCVAGLRLQDGREVVIKAYQPAWERAFLVAVAGAQTHLSDSGFPCPKPVFGPGRAGPAWAMAESLVVDPGMRVLETRAEMGASASGLATLIHICQGLNLPGLGHHPLTAAHGSLYPAPHNPIFDFSLDSESAKWIDDLARAAKDARAFDGTPPVIGHTDWSARNIRVDHDMLVAAYDWDSMALCAETTLVGQAAATWRSTGEAEDPVAPDANEVCEYISAYEQSSGRAFDLVQVRAALAAALWTLAYSARCEHALESATGRRLERARARLWNSGGEFLRS
jgi:Phosphotransferase enzyme family